MHPALEAIRKELFMDEREFRIGFPIFLTAMALLLLDAHVFLHENEVVNWAAIVVGLAFCVIMIRPMTRIVGNWVYIKRWLKHEDPRTQRYVKSRIWMEVSLPLGTILLGMGIISAFLGNYLFAATILPGAFLVWQYLRTKDSDLWNKSNEK